MLHAHAPLGGRADFRESDLTDDEMLCFALDMNFDESLLAFLRSKFTTLSHSLHFIFLVLAITTHEG